ncbi:MAG: anti-sigma factor [Stenomitos rutilans HA7619-LM2]|jgi:anti-sigma-K factor RskA|nr:anti-sigma factor [Stenomitos rutilans HA7619-LM2]
MNAEDRCFCELAPLYALNLLDDEDRRWVEAQVLENPELAAELAEYQVTVNTLPYGTPVVPMAESLKGRLFQRLAAEPAEVPLLTTEPAQEATPPALSQTYSRSEASARSRVVPFHRSRWPQAAGAIAALTAIVLLVDNYRLRERVQADQAIVATLQQPDSIVYLLRGTDKAANASGSLVVNSSHKTAVVLVQNLPALPDGQAYRLWAVPKGATKPVYCGQFNHDRTGTVHWSLPEAACSASVPQMLVTAESTSDPPIPTGPLVMKSTL